MSMDFSELQSFAKKLHSIDAKAVAQKCANDLAARFLREVTIETPTGVYDTEYGKVGGTLKRGWKVETRHDTGSISVDVINPTEYAQYVEYGHRQEVGRFVPAIGKRLVSPWVNGKFMMTRTEKHLAPKAQAIVDKKAEQVLKEIFK